MELLVLMESAGVQVEVLDRIKMLVLETLQRLAHHRETMEGPQVVTAAVVGLEVAVLAGLVNPVQQTLVRVPLDMGVMLY